MEYLFSENVIQRLFRLEDEDRELKYPTELQVDKNN